MNSLGTKTKYWSNEIVKRLPGLDTFNWRMWSQKGWEDTRAGKVRVAKFKHYTWARIFRIGDDNKDIFFTVGADSNNGGMLDFKLDYYYETNSHLNAEQKEIVERNIPSELRWKQINSTELENYNWDKLLDLTSSFISEHLHVYDKLVKLAWGETNPEEIFINSLRKQEFPDIGLSQLPELNPSFNEVDADYIKEAIERKEIGDAGEELVKQYEKNWLTSMGHHDLALKVDIVADGKGYDILSFHSDRSPKYIEVKTTNGNVATPFYYSLNEKCFAERNSKSYCIYRLYNYDEESNTADFYLIKNIEEDVLLQPINFRAYIKKKK